MPRLDEMIGRSVQHQVVGTIFDGLATGLDFTPLFEATAAAQPGPGAWAPRDGDWPASVECAAFVNAASSMLYVFSGQNYFTIEGDMDVISAAAPAIITSLDSIP